MKHHNEESDVSRNPQRYFYHASPPDSRETILKEGLKPGTTASYGEPGVYVFNNELIADNYKSEPMDVWKVDLKGYTIFKDPEDAQSASYVEKSVPPERLKLQGTFEDGQPVERNPPIDLGAIAKRFPKAGSAVSGLKVREDIPNTDSIGASLGGEYDYDVLPGIREVSMAMMDPNNKPVRDKRTEKLAHDIAENMEINPLIIVVDDEQYPYILEGGHRYDALRILGIASFPALVVVENREPLENVERNPPIDFSKIKAEIHDRFDQYNQVYFGGVIPHPQIKFVKLKGRSGTTDMLVKSHGISIADLKHRNRFLPLTPAEAEITVPSITFSTLQLYDEAHFNGILLHEMIHAFLAVTGWPFEQHEARFLEKAHEVEKRSGITVPLTHIIGMAEVVGKLKETGVFIVKAERDQPEQFLLFQPKALDLFIEKAKKYLCTLRRPVQLWIIQTTAWARTVVSPKPAKYGLMMQRLTPEYGIDLTDGWLAWEGKFDKDGKS